MEMIDRWTKAGEAKSVGLLGNAAEILPEMVRRGIRPDMVTDQTSAHDPINGYLPKGWTMAEWKAKRESDPKAVEKAARASMREHVEAMIAFQDMGMPDFRLRQQHPPGRQGRRPRKRLRLPGLRAGLHPPAVLPRHRPVPLGGPLRRSGRHLQDRRQGQGTDPRQHAPAQLARHGRERIAFQGLPARICWVGLGDRHRLGLAFNEMVRTGELKAPIVIGRDHLDSGSVASPNRETEAMKDGSDAVSDWPLLNALLNTASGATWVSLHHGGGVGMGFSQHSGMVICCDGTDEAPAASNACCGTTRQPASCATPTPATTSPSTAPGKRACACRAFSGIDGNIRASEASEARILQNGADRR